MKARTNPQEVQGVPKYPESLQIYRIAASRFWQVRLFVDRKYIRKSTKCLDRDDAIEFAKQFYDEIRIAQRLDFNVHTDTFAACANHLLKRQEALINRGERNGRINIDDKGKLDKDILPFFGTLGVAEITTLKIEEYLDQLSSQRKLSPSTLAIHLVVIRKVFNEAKKRGFIKSLPIFPTIRRRDNPRAYFDDVDYKKLRDTAKKLATEGIKVRYVPLTIELYELILFSVNVFVRLSDIKNLRHKHIRIVRDKKTEYLSITPPESKTVIRESVSMRTAVAVYERLREMHQKDDLASENDYVFFPKYTNRDYALQTMRRQFEFVLKKADLKFDRNERPRTLYSLRHTALMFRLLKSENIDIFMLARNALTSVSQLERFYLSHAESKMKIENLQSFA